MDLTTIITFSTFVVTYIFGEVSKKFNILEKKYIPLQNICIGIVAAILYCLLVDNSNLKNAFIIVISALSSAGLYDAVNLKNK